MIHIDKKGVWHILLQIILLLLVTSLLLILNKNIIFDFYNNDLSHHLGLWLNGGILLLFALGLSRIIQLLFHYLKEQSNLLTLVQRLEKQYERPIENLNASSTAVWRYHRIVWLAGKNTPVNHAALATTLNARENARLTFVRFIQNILILAGVFGTIVSLSIALLGASDVLASAENLENISVIIDGMSTALSTTMTAIVCFVIFIYFSLRLRTIQTNFIAGVEEMTLFYLLPGITHDKNSLLQSVGQLVAELRQVVKSIHVVQRNHAENAQRLQLVVDDFQQSVGNLDQNMLEIQSILREGFRLAQPPSLPYSKH